MHNHEIGPTVLIAKNMYLITYSHYGAENRLRIMEVAAGDGDVGEGSTDGLHQTHLEVGLDNFRLKLWVQLTNFHEHSFIKATVL